MTKKAVVYGAGQSGRGYLARFLKESGYQITFIETDRKLVDLLNEDKYFFIHFYHKDRTPVLIDQFHALTLDDDLSSVLKEADIILTAVGEQNLKAVAASLAKYLEKTELPQLLTAENGTNPARVLRKELEKQYKGSISNVVSQTAIFCSTINIEDTRLDILSQNETYFPYDLEGFNGSLDFPGAEPRKNFEHFFERKIYTYNCLAGLISYLGYVKGYKIYGEATNDTEVSKIIDELLEILNPSLAEYFNISLEEQELFANKAVEKFKDMKILDYVIKNGRAPRRKLGKSERIYAPYKILINHDQEATIMCLVAGAALVYLEEIEYTGHSFDPEEELLAILDLNENDPFVKLSVSAYEHIKQNRATVSLVELLNSLRAE
ncbi:hypothetical protein ACS127_07405 [Amphibacillus sp. Q70]|uniref:mannitol dehydrogenase family protein n=1 Tax=Amphibacillus sp. Q70 TaxID=3453416 RepID=UPI003F85A722